MKQEFQMQMEVPEKKRETDWDYCPSCGGDLDTGYECTKCGRDWQSYVHDAALRIETDTELEQFAGRFGTGVFAPDGYEESVWEEGFYCPRCVRVIGNDEFRQRLA